MDQPEEDNTVDIESGIDAWIIDKDDSNGSLITNDKVQGPQSRTMNKENINNIADLSDNALRFFRMSKSVVYHEASSESDSDSKKKHSSDKVDCASGNKKIRSESVQNSITTATPKNKPNNFSPDSSFDSLKSVTDKTCLSSEEISMILSEIDEKTENNLEKREKLHSIENVSVGSVSKEKSSDTSSLTMQSFACPVCDLEYTTIEDLESHVKSHRRLSVSSISIIGSDSDQCINGSDSTKHESTFLNTFQKHVASNGPNPSKNGLRKIGSRFFKRRCTQEEDDSDKLITKKSYSCNICSFQCPDILKYKTHMILFHSDSAHLTCEYCNYEALICVDLATHMKIHLNTCDLCGYQCLGRCDLNEHMNKRHFTFKCSKCEFSCVKRREFNCHLKKHILVEKFKCDHCKLSFSGKIQLKHHIIGKHSVQSKQFKCQKCEKSFPHKEGLKNHMRRHIEPLVDKRFVKHNLNGHNKVSFKCRKCNSSFSGKQHLQLHFCNSKPKQSSSVTDVSKHICIDKLYDVQKRSLNFTRESSETNSEVNSTVSSESENHNHLNLTEESNNFNLRSLRQNLPSRRNGATLYTTEKINGKLQCRSKNHSKSAKVISKKIHKTIFKSGHTFAHTGITKMKRNSLHAKNNPLNKVKKDHMKRLLLKKQYPLKDLDCIKVIFCKKTSLTSLLIDPVQFVGERYVECYYQSQPGDNRPTLEHMERHLRQRSLLSCPLCRYKTNSQQLLQRHTAENHTWGRAIVHALFS